MTTPTLADLLSRAEPNHPAVIRPDDSATTSYRSLADQVEDLAGTLRASGLEPGQTVGIVLANGLEFLVAFLAVTRARLIAAPLNWAYKEEEFRFYYEDSEAKAVIVPPGDVPARDMARGLGLRVWTVTMR